MILPMGKIGETMDKCLLFQPYDHPTAQDRCGPTEEFFFVTRGLPLIFFHFGEATNSPV